jgi:hypothetical protein
MEYQEWYMGTEEMKMYMLLVCNVFSEGTVPMIWQETRAFCIVSQYRTKELSHGGPSFGNQKVIG